MLRWWRCLKKLKYLLNACGNATENSMHHPDMGAQIRDRVPAKCLNTNNKIKFHQIAYQMKAMLVRTKKRYRM